MSYTGKVEIGILKRGAYPLPNLLDEADFDNQMKTVAEPCISRYRETGRFGENSELFYEIYRLEPNLGTVIICHGYMESCAKYHEFIYYLLKCGFQVGIYDQRGHGKSVREGTDPDIVHIDSFDSYVDDLKRFVDDVAVGRLNAVKSKLYLFGHSFGGCVGARYIEDNPSAFAKVILNSPMFGINFGSLPEPVIMFISDCMIAFRQGGHRCIGQRAFDRRPNPAVSAGSSEARYLYYHRLRTLNKEYQVSGSDYYWLREIMKAGYRARKSMETEKIRSDILVIMAGQDDVADRDAQETFVSRLKYGRAVLIPESKHETFNEKNSVLKDFLSLVMSWYNPEIEDI